MTSRHAAAARKEPLVAVFGALANPTRRRLLDELRKGPRTTGQLADLVPLTRFAVMQHLSVLTRARLVTVERRGRERWNHLNAVPLQMMQERWVRPYEAHWAGALLRLKRTVEKEEEMTKKQVGAPAPAIREIAFEVSIAAAPERVWKAVVEETTSWWSRDFLLKKDAKAFVIESTVGGRVYEDWGGGNGVLWYTVAVVDPPRALHLAGHLFPGFGGPATTMLRLDLKAETGGTRLTVSDAIVGNVSDKGAAGIEEGWRFLFGTCLKAWTEKKTKRKQQP